MILGRNSISTNRDQQYFRPGHVPSYSQASHIHELVKGYTPKTNSKPQQRVSPRYVHPRVHQYRSRPLTILALPITISHWLFLPFQPITSDRIDALFQGFSWLGEIERYKTVEHERCGGGCMKWLAEGHAFGSPCFRRAEKRRAVARIRLLKVGVGNMCGWGWLHA